MSGSWIVNRINHRKRPDVNGRYDNRQFVWYKQINNGMSISLSFDLFMKTVTLHGSTQHIGVQLTFAGRRVELFAYLLCSSEIVYLLNPFATSVFHEVA